MCNFFILNQLIDLYFLSWKRDRLIDTRMLLFSLLFGWESFSWWCVFLLNCIFWHEDIGILSFGMKKFQPVVCSAVPLGSIWLIALCRIWHLSLSIMDGKHAMFLIHFVAFIVEVEKLGADPLIEIYTSKPFLEDALQWGWWQEAGGMLLPNEISSAAVEVPGDTRWDQPPRPISSTLASPTHILLITIWRHTTWHTTL